MRWGRLLGFLGVGLALHLLLVRAYVSSVSDGHKAFRNDRVFLAGPRRVDLLVVGDSHPRTAIDARALGPGCANIAVGGQDLLKSWYRASWLVERGDKDVRALLLPLDPGGFSSWHADVFAPELVWGRYVDFLAVGREQGRPLAFLSSLLKARLVPYAGELRTFNQLRTRRFSFGEDLPGGSFARFPPAERMARARNDAREHFRDQDLMHDGLRAAWDRLVGWADERGIPVVAVSFPTSAEYERWVERAGAREVVETRVARPFVAAAPDRHLWLDLHDLFHDRPDAFADSNHLNAGGRAAFSALLAEELRGRGLLGE